MRCGIFQVEHYLMSILILLFFSGFFRSLRFFFSSRIRSRFRHYRRFLPLYSPGICKLFRSFTGFAFRLFFMFQETETEKFSQPDNGTCTQINKETYSSNQQYHPQPRHSHLRHQPVADIISVHAAQIEERVLILVHKHEPEEYRKPNQQQGASYEPLPQTYHADTHQL